MRKGFADGDDNSDRKRKRKREKKERKNQGIFSFSEREKVGEEGYTLKLDLRRQSGIRRQRESVFLSFSQECNYRTQLFVFCRNVWANDRNKL